MKPPLAILIGTLFIAMPGWSAAERPPAPPVSHFRGQCPPDPDGSIFAAKVHYSSYDPSNAGYDNTYQGPNWDTSTNVPQQQLTIFKEAYKLAPPYIQQKLCLLTQVFIRPSTSSSWESWGFWEGGDRPPGSRLFIALSDLVVGDQLHGIAPMGSLVVEENAILTGLLGPTVSQFTSTTSPKPEQATLAALAHELGHVLVADADADGWDDHHPRAKVSGRPSSDCFEKLFLGQSWDADAFHQNMRRWVDFGEQYGNIQNHIKFDLYSADPKTAVDIVLGSKEFVSILAATNPVEDLVETYKYKVLSDVKPPPNLSIPINGKNTNVFDLLREQVIARKVSCLHQLKFGVP